MLSRRHLRVKVLQALYAFFLSGNDSLQSGEKQLVQSIDKLNEQYYYLLSFITEIFDFAKLRLEERKNKYLPTEEDLHPNTKFIDNKLGRQLASNHTLQRYEDQLKINWKDESEMIRKFFKAFVEDRKYIAYMQSNDFSYQADKDIVISMLKHNISDYESLEQFFEDRNIYWASDYFIAIWLLLKTLKSYKEDWGTNKDLPSIVFLLKQNEDDWNFMIKLFRKTILKSKPFEELIDAKAQNWELERIASMDILILKMALTELTEFPSIPVKVSLNEYIELAKIFSTAKSRVFINGILDKLIDDLQKSGEIKKMGRGLMT